MRRAVLLVGSIVLASAAHAQGNLAAKLIGAWKLVSTEQRLADGSTRPMPNLGPGAYLHYSEGRRMCAVLMNPDRPKWRSRSVAEATDAELASAARGYFALC